MNGKTLGEATCARTSVDERCAPCSQQRSAAVLAATLATVKGSAVATSAERTPAHRVRRRALALRHERLHRPHGLVAQLPGFGPGTSTQFLGRATGLDVEELSYRVIELGSDEIFNHPFAYVSEPGEMELTEQEVENLREYIESRRLHPHGRLRRADPSGRRCARRCCARFRTRDFVPLHSRPSAFSARTP